MFVAGETGGPAGNLHPDQFLHVQLHAPKEDPLARIHRLASTARGSLPGMSRSEQISHDAQTAAFSGHAIAPNIPRAIQRQAVLAY